MNLGADLVLIDVVIRFCPARASNAFGTARRDGLESRLFTKTINFGLIIW
jgi:hypothetical protein